MLVMAELSKQYKMPIPVYTRVYSNAEKGFISENEEELKGLRHLSNHFDKSNIRTLDKGYDAKAYYNYFLEHDEKFVIIVKSNRNVIYKGKYSMKFKGKEGKTINCKISNVLIFLF